MPFTLDPALLPDPLPVGCDAVPAPEPEPIGDGRRSIGGRVIATCEPASDADADAVATADADAGPDPEGAAEAEAEPDPDADPEPAAAVGAAGFASPAFIKSAPAVARPASSRSSSTIAIVGARVIGMRSDASDGSNTPRTGGSTAVSFVNSGFAGATPTAGVAITTGSSMRAPHTPQNRDPSSLALPQRAQLVVAVTP